MNDLIAAMVGRSLDNRFPPVDNTPGETILSVKDLSTKFAPYLDDVSFDVKEGEIFGLYGLSWCWTYRVNGNNLWCSYKSRRSCLLQWQAHELR